MKITYLDEPAYLPETAIRTFETYGEFTAYYDQPTREEAIRRLNDTDIAILEWTRIDRDMFAELKRVKYIIVALTGYSSIDVSAAKDYGILVSNVPDYSTKSVAEEAFALLLATNRKIIQSDRAARRGQLDPSKPFIGQELFGKTLGVFGLGDIGSWVAKIGQGFGMQVIGTSRSPKHIPGVSQVDLEELLRRSDALIVCSDRNKTTEGLFSEDRLRLMKKSAYLVSIVGGVCDEDVLARRLDNGELAGVGLDIPRQDTPLLACDNAVITTHIAWFTHDSLDRLIKTIAENVEMYINGNPQNVVNV